ncbi:MAG: hypothetical protein L3K02_03010 [Thermoplasmata archaeon]|nr:hypothetical protein [Thermoplasmata archaeon]
MDDEEGTFVTAGDPPPEEFSSRVLGSTWVGVAVLGVALFLLGIWTPAWHHVSGGSTLELIVAAAGGGLFLVGATYAWRAYEKTQSAGPTLMPGVELFTPPTLGRVTPPEPPSDEEPL